MKTRSFGSLSYRVLILGFVAFAATAAAQTSPVPFVNQPLVPSAVVPGAPGFTLVVNGTGFVPGDIVNWNGAGLVTTFVSVTQLTAQVPAANIAMNGTTSVTVSNAGLGSLVSNAGLLQVTSPEASVHFTQAGYYITLSGEYMAGADFNGDGVPDMAVSNHDYEKLDGNVLVMAGIGNGYFHPLSTTPLSLSGALVAGDFNGDGKQDVAIVSSTGARRYLNVLLGNGDGTFQQASGLLKPLNVVAIAAGDVNGDGKLDVIALDGNGGVAILLGDGKGGLTSFTQYGGGGAGASAAVALGDFNGDGKLDLAYTAGNSVYTLLGNGDGTFQQASEHTSGQGACSVAAADFNGDNFLDLAVGNCTDGTVSIFAGRGDGTFQTQQVFPAGYDPVAIVTGDFNGDGKLDLAAGSGGNNTYNGVNLMLGNGDGTFQSPVPYFTNSGATSLVAGDFNRDGRLDIALLEYSSTVVTTLVQTAPR